MGHSVYYIGFLEFEKPLTQEQRDLITTYQKIEDYFYALRLERNRLRYNTNCEKIYPDTFYNVIKEFVKELKALGNDFTRSSYLASCNEYGLDAEAIILTYKNGFFEEKPLLELIKEYVS
jgi:hypothetical protein